MKKAVGLLFSLVLLASIVNAWGPLAHNAIVKAGKGTTTSYLMGGTGPDVGYFLTTDSGVVFHDNNTVTDKRFVTALYNAAGSDSNKKKFAVGWYSHNLADNQYSLSGFPNTYAVKQAIDTVAYYDLNGVNYVAVYSDQVAKAYKDYYNGRRIISSVDVDGAVVLAKAEAAGSLAAAKLSNVKNAKKTINSNGGYDKFATYYNNAVRKTNSATLP